MFAPSAVGSVFFEPGRPRLPKVDVVVLCEVCLRRVLLLCPRQTGSAIRISTTRRCIARNPCGAATTPRATPTRWLTRTKQQQEREGTTSRGVKGGQGGARVAERDLGLGGGGCRLRFVCLVDVHGVDRG